MKICWFWFELKLLLVDFAFSARLCEKATRVSQRFGMLTINFSRCVCEERPADGLRAADRYDDRKRCVLSVKLRVQQMRIFKGVEMRRRFENFARSADGWFCLRELLSADICCGVVLLICAGSGNAKLLDFEAFEESLCERSAASVSCLGVSGNQAGPSGSSVGRSPHP
ncbi:ATP phosphoribosyl transferase 2 isoform 1 [Dorcoceras hygrometricum]|uniref:ATP phosphoribosyl transferase 2 isoform 1 n=1 Tax=Dorcoceras hygrometricum TaxID=472368 RepID=A0A2Z7AL89_9LAMI|nr:ATP phosphoribosyl transferase 2 isoform 1 [Dorcoceras hygrometricum]